MTRREIASRAYSMAAAALRSDISAGWPLNDYQTLSPTEVDASGLAQADAEAIADAIIKIIDTLEDRATTLAQPAKPRQPR